MDRSDLVGLSYTCESDERDRLRLRVRGGVGSEWMDVEEWLRLRGLGLWSGSSTGGESSVGSVRGMVEIRGCALSPSGYEGVVRD